MAEKFYLKQKLIGIGMAIVYHVEISHFGSFMNYLRKKLIGIDIC